LFVLLDDLFVELKPAGVYQHAAVVFTPHVLRVVHDGDHVGIVYERAHFTGVLHLVFVFQAFGLEDVEILVEQTDLLGFEHLNDLVDLSLDAIALDYEVCKFVQVLQESENALPLSEPHPVAIYFEVKLEHWIVFAHCKTMYESVV